MFYIVEIRQTEAINFAFKGRRTHKYHLSKSVRRYVFSSTFIRRRMPDGLTTSAVITR